VLKKRVREQEIKINEDSLCIEELKEKVKALEE
jgi:hypothetical protein